MKILAILTTMVFATQAMAQVAQDPSNIPSEQLFDFTKRITNSTQVSIETASNVKEACDRKAMSYQIKPAYVNPMACSFWTKTTCVIIVGEKTSLDTLGHEIRHCFQGHWHKWVSK
jgi:hypothetical protein